MMTIPIETRLLAAAPSARAIGRTPKAVARAGHQNRAESLGGGIDDGFLMRQTLSLTLIGEFHDQDAVFGDDANQGDDSDLAEDIKGLTEQPERQDCSGQRQRNGEHDNQRITETFELRRQNQIDQNQRQQKGKEQSVGTLRYIPWRFPPDWSRMIRRARSPAILSISLMPSPRVNPFAMRSADTVADT